MATITEVISSGEGDSDGFRGTFATRRFNVRLNPANTDSVTGLLDDVNNPILPLAERYPLGSPHNVASGIIAWDHRKVRRHPSTFGFWICEIEYQAPLVANLPPTETWQIEYNTAIETEQMVRAFLLAADGTRASTREVAVGGRAYKTILSPETLPPRVFNIDTVDGTEQLKRIESDDIVTDVGVTRFAPITSFSLRRTVANMNVAQANKADEFVSKTNAQTFYGKAPGRVLVGPFRIASRAGEISNQLQLSPGTVFDVELNFLVNRKGWEPSRIFDRLTRGEFTSNIKDASGVEQFRDFETYDSANPGDLLKIFVPGLRRIPGSKVP